MNEETSVVLQAQSGVTASAQVVHVNATNSTVHPTANVASVHQIIQNTTHGVIVPTPQVMGLSLTVSGMYHLLSIMCHMCHYSTLNFSIGRPLI